MSIRTGRCSAACNSRDTLAAETLAESGHLVAPVPAQQQLAFVAGRTCANSGNDRAVTIPAIHPADLPSGLRGGALRYAWKAYAASFVRSKFIAWRSAASAWKWLRAMLKHES